VKQKKRTDEVRFFYVIKFVIEIRVNSYRFSNAIRVFRKYRARIINPGKIEFVPDRNHFMYQSNWFDLAL
jgi:hypothetical protein